MPDSPLRVIYAGTPDFAVPALQALIDANYDIAAVYTQPDRPAGRGKKLQMSPVKQLALQADIDVQQPQHFKAAEDREVLAAYKADLMVVAAYGLILPQSVLDMPKHGCWNIHASLLPRWRGAAPIQHAILAGDQKTGITLMQMAAGLDTGDMLLKSDTAINADDNAQTLHDRLANMGAQLLLQGLQGIAQLQAERQDDALANYAHKIIKQDALIDWSSSAEKIDRHIRAYYGWPVAFTRLADKPADNVRIWSAQIENHELHSAEPGTIIRCDKQGLLVQTGAGQLNINSLQLPGAKRLHITDFINAHDLTGQCFLSPE